MTFLSILDSIFLEPFKALIEIIYFLAYMISKEPALSVIMLATIMSLIMLAIYKCINRFQERLRKRRAELEEGINHIKQNYTGDDKKDLLKSYYKRNNYSPLFELNDFLYLIFEIPVFVAFIVFLPNLFIFKDTSFLFISNLAKPDALIKLGKLKINVLPFLMLAINVASVILYSKDKSLQSKIQLLVWPVVSFFILYNAASVLIFYWIIYNTFCLLNTVSYKFKKSKLIVNLSISALGIISLIVGIFNTNYLLLGAVLELPIFFYLCKLAHLKITNSEKFRKKFPKKKKIKKPSWKQFLITASALTLLVGAFIPSAYIEASPLEYINPSIFYNPLNYVFKTFLTAAGCFIVWLQIFYWLSSKRHKNIINKVIFTAFVIMIIDYMFFGLNLGIISASLRYDTPNLFFKVFEVVLNSLLTIAFIVLIFFAYKSIRSYVALILSALVVIMSGMSIFNIIKSAGEINDYKKSTATQTGEDLSFTLSTTGHNVVVIMLDRALGQYVPYILNEKPELNEKYDGFTYYNNTLSFGYYTNICTPSLLAGYEYTPVELNKRDDEYLKDKQNEANLMLPRLFSEKGYNVTVSDPPYVNYTHMSDLSMFEEYNIKAFYSIGKFMGDEQVKYAYEITSTNFFRFSFMKTLPLLAQFVFYNYGNYNNIQSVYEIDRYSNQNLINMSKATGINSTFMDQYLTLTNMNTMTNITSDETNTYLFFRNDLPHEVMLLDAENGYIPSSNVDNTEYDKTHADRFTLNGITVNITSAEQMAHYHSTASALIQLTSWLDYLKANGTYDNTKIIIASDHGRFIDTIDELNYKGEDLEGCCPLLMVKDFGETGTLKISNEFMTNADVATLATKHLGDEAVNPFTGKPINMNEKYAHKQYISTSFEWNVYLNDGKTFKASKWLEFDSTMENCNIYNQNCWNLSSNKSVLKTHSF